MDDKEMVRLFTACYAELQHKAKEYKHLMDTVDQFGKALRSGTVTVPVMVQVRQAIIDSRILGAVRAAGGAGDGLPATDAFKKVIENEIKIAPSR